MRKSLYSCIEDILVEPHMSICTSSRILDETISLRLKGKLCCLGKWHESHALFLLNWM